MHKPFPKQQTLGSSKLKEFADDNFKLDENRRKIFKCLKNTVEKGEIAHYEQILLFPQCFQKICTADMYKPGLVQGRVKPKSCFSMASYGICYKCGLFGKKHYLDRR